MEMKSVSRPNSSKSVRSNSSVTSSRTNNRSEELAIFNKSVTAAKAPHPPGLVNDIQNSSRESLASSSVVLGYEGDKAKPPGNAVKGNSLTDSRRRIADAVGRR